MALYLLKTFLEKTAVETGYRLTMTRSMSRDHLVLAGLLLLALALRVWKLNQPLWFDEIITLETHVGLSWGEMMQSYSMNHHYLFSFQAKVFTSIFGDHAWALRMPSVLFGTATVAAIWWVARSISGVRIAHITALLVALSYHQIWFSQNARGYTELAFWCTLAMGLFLHGVRAPTPKVWLIYGVTIAFALATHLTGMFFILSQGLVWVALALANIRQNKSLDPIVKWPAVGFLVGGLLTTMFYAPVIASAFEVAGAVGQEESSSQLVAQFNNPIWTLLEGIQTAFGSGGLLIPVVALGAMAVIGLGAWAIWSTEKLFPIIVFLHIVLTVILLSLIGMRIWPRFFFVDIALIMLLIVLGVQFVTNKFTELVKRGPTVPYFAISVAMMVLLSVVLAARNYAAPKQDLAGAFELVEDLRAPQEKVYAVGVGAEIFLGHYAADWDDIYTSEQFLAIPEPSPRDYFVIAFPNRTTSEIPELGTLIEAGALKEVAYFHGTLGDGGVAVFSRDQS